MTRDEKLAGVDEFGPWFHCIDLGDGVVTKSAAGSGQEPDDHPKSTWNVIRRFLPEDLLGLDVLDVGCNAGFYAIEAKRRGARRVLGVEAKRQHVRQAKFARQALGLDIEYRRGSVYDLRVATLGYVENLPDALEASYNWFLPSADSLPALIRQGGFDEVDVVDVLGARAVCVCRKTREAPDSSSPAHLRAALSLDHQAVTCTPGEALRVHGGRREHRAGYLVGRERRPPREGDDSAGRAPLH